jgi:hypothetical protein
LKYENSIYSIFVGLILILNPYFLSAQQYEGSAKEEPVFANRFSVSVYGTYVSSAELMDNINSPVAFIRDASVELAGGYGYGAEFTYDPSIEGFDVLFYLSSEYLNVEDDGLLYRFDQDTLFANVRFTEQFKMIPIEGGIKWNLPISTQRVKIYIGGGAGVYFGERNRKLGPIKTTNISTNPGFSMNVLVGGDYFFTGNLSGNFEFKFREASFESEEDFGTDSIVVNGNTFMLENPINSRILVDGVRLSAGIKFHF